MLPNFHKGFPATVGITHKLAQYSQPLPRATYDHKQFVSLIKKQMGGSGSAWGASRTLPSRAQESDVAEDRVRIPACTRHTPMTTKLSPEPQMEIGKRDVIKGYSSTQSRL